MTWETLADDAERIRLGRTEYLWKGGQLHDARGKVVPLRAKSLSMFAALLAERETVISKDRLCELVWPDGIATDESIARCIADIRKALGDSGHRVVETFPKQGYRLNVARPVLARVPALRRRGIVGALAVGAIAVIGGLWWLAQEQPASGAADEVLLAPPADLREAVAILPFSANEEEDQFLAAGLSDDIEIHLAEMSAIKIISQAQSQAVSKGAGSPVDIARMLDARYLVLGAVRQSGVDIAVSLQLVDGSDGTTLWADRYEGPRRGLLTFRHGWPEALLRAMSVALDARDLRRLAVKDTADPQAFEEVLRARRALSAFTYEESLAAELHLRRALERDPEYARAYAELAAAFAIRFENHWVVLSSADVEKAFYFARRALDLDPDLWLAHYAMGRLHSVTRNGDLNVALQHLRTAMSLQPANDDARVYYGVVTMMSGHPEEALPIFESVMATHPQPPFWYYLGLGNALFHLRRYEDAEAAFNTCLYQMPGSPYCQRPLIATYARLDQLEDAAWTIEEYEINGYSTSLETMMELAIERDPELRKHLRESYLLAGLK